jgi:large subunit ribosomal protein L6
MSRVGKQILQIPAGTEVTITEGLVTVKGKKGEIKRSFRTVVEIKKEGDTITLSPHKKDAATRALWGTYASHIQNMLKGVSEGFVQKLILEGIGYKADVAGTNLNMALGFSHPVVEPIPEGVTVVSEKGVLTISGFNKETVSQFAAKVRSLKKPEPYKGKGFRYEGEVIKRKQGKKSA